MSDTVEHLITAGLEAMEGLDEPYTHEELLGACFSLCLRVIDAAIEQTPALMPAARAGAQVLLLRCVSGKPN